MPKDEGVNFDYDERTDIPTYEEISSSMSSLKKAKKQKKNTKPKTNKNLIANNNKTKKHHFFKWILVIIIILLIIGASAYSYFNYPSIKSSIIKSNKVITGMVSSYLFSPINYENSSIWGTQIIGVNINLTNEEKEMNKSLENKLETECQSEKGKVAKEIRTQKEDECDNEKTELETEVNTLKDRVESLVADLDDCEDGV